MKREIISEALDGIEMKYIAECESYHPKLRMLPSGKENKMGRYEHTTKNTRRKVIALILAACLMIGLGITSYASGGFASLIARFADALSIDYLKSLIERHPESAEEFQELIDEQMLLQEIGEKAEKRNETVASDDMGASVTLLESYYDGEKVSMACQLVRNQAPISFAFDENHTMFAQLREVESYSAGDGIVSCTDPEEQAMAEKILKEHGKVGFITCEIFVRDHVYVNGEDCGPCHSEMDPDGYFVVKPYIDGIGFVELPENSRNQPSVEITLNLGKVTWFHWYENGKYLLCAGDLEDFPVTFVVENSTMRNGENG